MAKKKSTYEIGKAGLLFRPDTKVLLVKKT